MPEQRSKFAKRIQYLNRLVLTKRDNRGSRDLMEEEIAKYNRELKELSAKRKAEQRICAVMTKETDRAMEHTTGEANRIIAATTAGTATLERRLDRLEARSSGRDDLLQRLVGQPGSSKEIQAEIDARKEDLKRKRREEREEDKQAEKRRKLEQLLEIPLEEGDTLQDGVVLRGDLGRRKKARLPGCRGLPLRQAPLLPRGNRRDGHASAGSLERSAADGAGKHDGEQPLAGHRRQGAGRDEGRPWRRRSS